MENEYPKSNRIISRKYILEYIQKKRNVNTFFPGATRERGRKTDCKRLVELLVHETKGDIPV